ncbi:MAG: hypothetical protein LBH91_05790 [Prevotellaceae bacterium]|jgi:hypothetical protein|nr:hypothetical protein [Prevotellaceae bacterium]
MKTKLTQKINKIKHQLFTLAMPLLICCMAGGLYAQTSDVLQIGGSYMEIPLPGYIRRIGQQRVAIDDSKTNTHIKVTASPASFTIVYPTTNTVDLNLNIDHTGMSSIPYVPLDVIAKYLVTTEANYTVALTGNPDISSWPSMNVPVTNNGNATTRVSFASMSQGTYYIHWYVESGVAYAHSLDLVVPPATYGGFGAYQLVTNLTPGTISGSTAVPSVTITLVPD